MGAEPLFLTLDEILEIHRQQIELYGGSAGVRDPDGLESAIAMSVATLTGRFLHPSIPAMAAARVLSVEGGTLRKDDLAGVFESGCQAPSPNS